MIVITVGDVSYADTQDRVTCRQPVTGRGHCNLQVPLRDDGAPPLMCPSGHVMPGWGTHWLPGPRRGRTTS